MGEYGAGERWGTKVWGRGGRLGGGGEMGNKFYPDPYIMVVNLYYYNVVMSLYIIFVAWISSTH